MANAAFSSLCSQAALALVNNDGNFGKAAKHLTTTDAFKSLGIAVATAGLSETGLGRVVAGFTVDVATGKKIDEAALSAARVAVASTLQASVAKHIGAGGFDPFTKAALHGISGAGTGAMLSENAEEGAISGGLSSMVATTVANFIKEDPNIIGERAVAKAKADGSSLDKASLQPYVQAELRATIDISRLSAAVATLFAGYDVNVGIETATTAVINNCAATMERQVFESSALKEALQEAVDAGKVAAADAMDKTADYIDEHPEVVEAGAHVLMGMGGVMADDKGTKTPKIRSKGQAKADKVLAKGYITAPKYIARELRSAAEKMRGNKVPSAQSAQITKGKAIRGEAIPAGSKLEYLGPGKVKFDGVEFRAVRDLEHVESSTLWDIYRSGRAPRSISGEQLRGHHHRQQYHRDSGAFIVEMPASNHNVSNPLQHPYGNIKGMGLKPEQRSNWNKLRESFHKERAKAELSRRGEFNE
ncbi:MAG: DUF637 domain-containing protein [Alphaproteobacteria bacterium]|nr:DUF637 domain-containing protein [Alphaproteobacteria bacterium]